MRRRLVEEGGLVGGYMRPRAQVERREAPPLSDRGAGGLTSLPGGADRKAPPKGVSPTPWRLPALHPLAGNGKGEWANPAPTKQ